MSSKFRRDVSQLNAEDKELIDRVMRIAEELYESIDMAPPSNARDQAVLKLQECVMWSVKAVSDHR